MRQIREGAGLPTSRTNGLSKLPLPATFSVLRVFTSLLDLEQDHNSILKHQLVSAGAGPIKKPRMNTSGFSIVPGGHNDRLRWPQFGNGRSNRI
jgi:hypothetical protein